jgi:hypothetical protein
MKSMPRFVHCFLCLSLICLLLSWVPEGQAQARDPRLPFHAKIERIQQLFGPDGSLENEQSITESYFRGSEGSTYTKGTVIDSTTGKIEHPVRIIENAGTDQVYVIDDGNRTVMIQRLRFKSGGTRPNPELPRKEYLGRPCAVMLNPEQGGELWIDLELGYPLYHRREMKVDGGRKMIRISRVTELTVDAEPDPGLFDLPHLDEYSVIDHTR